MTGEAEVLDRGDMLPEAQPAPEPAPAPEPEAPAPEPEKAEEGAVKEEPPRGEDGKFIPKGVFDNRLRAEREAREAAERRTAELEAMMGQVKRGEDVEKLEGEIVELEKQHAKLLLDGDHEKAALAMRDIRLKERQIAVQESQHMTAQAKDQAREEIKVDLAIERIETKYDVLRPDSADYDQDVVNDVLDWQQVYMRRGIAPSAALIKAAEKVMEAFKPADVPAPKAGLAAAQAPDRRAEQLAKNIAADKAQPPNMRDVGLDSDKAGVKGDVDPAKLTQEEFDALPEATKAKLRGDSL